MWKRKQARNNNMYTQDASVIDRRKRGETSKSKRGNNIGMANIHKK